MALPPPNVHIGPKGDRKFSMNPSAFSSASGLILGLYAAHPPLQERFLGSQDEVEFYESAFELHGVKGLELPFTGTLHSNGIEWLSARVALNAEILITTLPGQMQNMAVDLDFGLASSSESGRSRAVQFIRDLATEAALLSASRPDLNIRAVEIHAGPRPTSEGSSPSAEAFQRSFDELREVDFLKSRLHLEFCDSFRGQASKPAKGFLPFDEVLEICEKNSLPLVVNWGRSAIDGQSAEEPLRHLRCALERRVLGGLIFSGWSRGHALYGSSSEDSHAPIAEAWDEESGRSGLALTESRIAECLALISSASGFGSASGSNSSQNIFLGLKVQPLPKDLSLTERLRFLKRNLESVLRVIDQLAKS